MSLFAFHRSRRLSKTLQASVSAFALAFLGAMPASADEITRSIDVSGTPEAIWAEIGPFCAIKDWHPAIGICTEDHATPTTRTLVTKDGKATFVETETARNDAKHRYTYTFVESPLPVTHYTATIAVTARSADVSTVSWSGSYTPDVGKEKEARDALSGIYQSGLDAIRAKLDY